MFQSKKHGGVDVVCCGAPLTKDHIEEFEAAVQECYGSGQPKLILDLSEAPLIDSYGLEKLLELQDQLEHLGGDMKLAAARPLVSDVLRVTGVADRFESFPTGKAAIGSFAR